MIKVNAHIKSIGVREVEGKEIKLKGYSKLKLYIHKVDKLWYIREFYTGRQLGSGTTEVNAKNDSKNYLKDYLLDQIVLQIESLPYINGDTDEKAEKETEEDK